MAFASQVLSPDGVLVIDDLLSWTHPQVTEAVLRYVRGFPADFALFLCGCNKAYLARPHAVHRYLEFCAQTLPEALVERGQPSTLSKTTFPAEMNTFGVGPLFEGRRLRGPDGDQSINRY